jgi:DNA-binding CsgD family transcriptional regulator
VGACRVGGERVRLAAMTGLAPRQLEAVRLVAQGMSDKEIARRMKVSESTVERTLMVCYAKLDARNRTHAAAIAVRQGLA